jgi:hypothetical protein
MSKLTSENFIKVQLFLSVCDTIHDYCTFDRVDDKIYVYSKRNQTLNENEFKINTKIMRKGVASFISHIFQYLQESFNKTFISRRGPNSEIENNMKYIYDKIYDLEGNKFSNYMYKKPTVKGKTFENLVHLMIVKYLMKLNILISEYKKEQIEDLDPYKIIRKEIDLSNTNYSEKIETHLGDNMVKILLKNNPAPIEFYNMIKNGLFGNGKEITFITDATKFKDEYFCIKNIENKSKYVGIFKKYNAFGGNGSNSDENIFDKKKKEKKEIKDSCIQTNINVGDIEGISYILTKERGELLLFDWIGKDNKNIDKFRFSYNNQAKFLDLDPDSENMVKPSLTTFLKAIYEIAIGENRTEKLKTLQKGAFIALEKMYKIRFHSTNEELASLMDELYGDSYRVEKNVKVSGRSSKTTVLARLTGAITSNTGKDKTKNIVQSIRNPDFQELNKKTVNAYKQKKGELLDKLRENMNPQTSERLSRDIIILEENDYVLALFDLKRAMDYLQVKACVSANEKDKKNYIFVSNDVLAITFALMNRQPCLKTAEIGKVKIGTLYNYNKKRKDIDLYNEEGEKKEIKCNKRQIYTIIKRLKKITLTNSDTSELYKELKNVIDENNNNEDCIKFIINIIQLELAEAKISFNTLTKINSNIKNNESLADILQKIADENTKSYINSEELVEQVVEQEDNIDDEEETKNSIGGSVRSIYNTQPVLTSSIRNVKNYIKSLTTLHKNILVGDLNSNNKINLLYNSYKIEIIKLFADNKLFLDFLEIYEKNVEDEMTIFWYFLYKTLFSSINHYFNNNHYETINEFYDALVSH